jgi:hypothetical protein
MKPKVFSCVHSIVAPHTDCETEQWISASISSTRRSQRAQTHVGTCSSGVTEQPLMCAGKPTAGWISPRSEPNRANFARVFRLYTCRVGSRILYPGLSDRFSEYIYCLLLYFCYVFPTSYLVDRALRGSGFNPARVISVRCSLTS